MPEASHLTLLLLPLAAAAGWFLATRFRPPEETRSVNPQYLRGLQHLVNEEADKAIEILINIAGVDNETVETHLALGNLFRRQGQVDRALRIHQNLVARPNLAPQHRNQARYELGRDYLTAGVLDRAEALFSDLVEQGMLLDKALRGLIRIFEQERDWEKAIDASRRLESAESTSHRSVIAQYFCELAEAQLRKGNLRDALGLVKKAQSEDKTCVRAIMLEGDVGKAQENYKQAEKAYQRALKQRPDLAAELLPRLSDCHGDDRKGADWSAALANLSSEMPRAEIQIARARQLFDAGKPEHAIEYLAEQIEMSPSWRVFAELMALTGLDDDPRFSGLEPLRKSLQRMIQASAEYRCEHCGFEGRHLHWQCPSCRRWDAQRAVSDVISDEPIAVQKTAAP